MVILSQWMYGQGSRTCSGNLITTISASKSTTLFPSSATTTANRNYSLTNSYFDSIVGGSPYSVTKSKVLAI